MTTSAKEPKDKVLTDDQQNTLKTLGERIRGRGRQVHDWATTVHRASGEHKDDTDPNWEEPNLFGILGPRGAGKSTILYALLRALDTEALHVLPPIDCSSLPKEVPPAAAVLAHLHGDDSFFKRMKRQTEARDLQEELKELASKHSQVDPRYQQLLLELSSTPHEFPDMIMQGVMDRLSLQRGLAKWLFKATSAAGVGALVVLLDDFDLISTSAVQSWMRALLDELHQTQLLLVATADFYRLEHLSYGGDGFDDMTGRALVNKLLPIHHRADIASWKLKNRLSFRPHSPKTEATLWGLFNKVKAQLPEQLRGSKILEALIPQLPRGLLNLYTSLETWKAESDDLAAVERLLMTFATCRAEPLLARRLGEVRQDEWLDEIFPASGNTKESVDGVEVWRATIKAASAQPSDSSQFEPLPSLAPPPVTASVPADELAHDPSWRDPLRHDQYLRDPLRDAQDRDRALWTELLLDMSLKDEPARARFINRWPPAFRRSRKTFFVQSFTDTQLDDFFASKESPFQPLLPWIRFAGRGDRLNVLQIGWHPLLKALRGARNPWPAAKLRELYLNVGVEPDALDPPGNLALLPNTVRPIALLVDALHRCPWEAYSHVTVGWSVVAWCRFAGALVRASYLHAMKTMVSGGNQLVLGDEDEQLQKQFESAGPTLGMFQRSGQRQGHMPAEELREMVTRALAADVSPPAGAGALGDAFAALKRLRAVRGLIQTEGGAPP